MNSENDFELPPAKKLRSDLLPSTDLASPHYVMEDDDDEDDDDLYGTPPLKTELTFDNPVQTIPTVEFSGQTNIVKASFSLPGLELVGDGLDYPSKRLPTAHTTIEYHNDTTLNIGLQNSATVYENTPEESEVSARSNTQIVRKCEGDKGTLGIENESADHRGDRVARDGILVDRALKIPRVANGQ